MRKKRLMRKLWIFGHSLCLPFNLKNPQDGWDQKLANELDVELINVAAPAVDNFYIYYKFLELRKKINPTDFVIIGWSHYSRKVFVVDPSNNKHQKLFNSSLIYQTEKATFMRNKNTIDGDPTKWLTMKPSNRGIDFYDDWYGNYYNELEQKSNLQSYLESVRYTCPGKYIPFYFSHESIAGIDVGDDHAGFITEFIIDNSVSISDNDFHLNEQGHRLWAEHMKNMIINHA